MKLKFKRFFVKFALFFLKSAAKAKKVFLALFLFVEKPLAFIGKILYAGLFSGYRVYFFLKKLFLKFIPAKDIRSLVTNKYLIHAVIIIIAIATVSQNIYAHSGVLGDYGKKSILFKLTRPIDEEETVEGLPIHSDIEEIQNGEAPVTNGDRVQAELPSVLGFIGVEQSPTLETKSTRTSIEYYVVKKGDNLGSIAQEFGISLNTLLWANKLTARSYIRPGDKLTVLPVSGVSHTIKKGDTLLKIASKYKANKEKIIEFNHLADASDLQVKQVLIIPDGKIIYVAPRRTYVRGFSPNTKSYTSSGKLLWPSPSKRITQYFHWRHPAIDVGLRSGSRIVASEAGTVIYSGWGKGYGYQVLIDHGNGFKTRYAHNSRLYVKRGSRVSRGQTIALSGNTGWSTGPHLHYEVYVNGVRRNPLLYVR